MAQVRLQAHAIEHPAVFGSDDDVVGPCGRLGNNAISRKGRSGPEREGYTPQLHRGQIAFGIRVGDPHCALGVDSLRLLLRVNANGGKSRLDCSRRSRVGSGLDRCNSIGLRTLNLNDAAPRVDGDANGRIENR